MKFSHISECQNIFGIELNDSERVFYFSLTDSAIGKEKYLHLLCNQILNVACRTDIVCTRVLKFCTLNYANNNLLSSL